MPHIFPPEIPKGKRLFDLLVAFLALIIFSPVLLIIALLVRIYHGAPILFKQQRPGYKEVPFFIYKFRTMTNRVDAQGNLLPDAKRLTRLGKFLRASSLDEVPEFLNVLRGDLSLVGPRPFLMEYLPLYNAEQMRRHEVLPGITGWAQINGRNNISWPEKFQLDLWYVDHWSFWLDLKILWQTIWKVFKREGINKTDEATTTYFTGNDE
ncbi:MAG: sugar transferase [Anaerolineales bacterium]|uniref:Sugar transferase n=1 Tax=Candidatus Desulfolinea nitratireducens TaxID=2841698 RepID=A0A8J6TK63_9CHLR|nr:sugar transferase [Candidatus Desulfolinea nitratireducens]MBL6961709.1 sugar transferase [Anaerolineales bacterium]